jgi:peptide/nickel transport system substrate-binding protein
MRRSALPLLVVTSMLLGGAAAAASRPRYGGTLRVAMRAVPTSLDPADRSQPESLAGHNLSRLIFDTLVVLDGQGRPQPALATSWQSEPGNQRWQFHIRKGVIFHDGTAVSSGAVAASLRAANPKWKVVAEEEGIVIECDSAAPSLPVELAMVRYGIAKRDGGKLTGSGAFSIAHWDPGKKLTLTARDDYWSGRAFIDSVEIEVGKSLREQMISLDLGKADLVEVTPDQAKRAATEGRRVETSPAAELMALVFTHDRPSSDDLRQRQTLALSIDRGSLSSVLLQGGADPAGGLLPDWMTGYAFLFSTEADLARAQQTGAEIRKASSWTLSYDGTDPVARVVAERIALNARDTGLMLQPTNSSNADVRLARVPLASVDARTALTNLAVLLNLPQPRFNHDSVYDLYAAENMLLQSRQIIPLLHLRFASGLGARVRNWTADRDGGWRLQDVWLETRKP